jgi:hypothetical protein
LKGQAARARDPRSQIRKNRRGARRIEAQDVDVQHVVDDKLILDEEIATGVEGQALSGHARGENRSAARRIEPENLAGSQVSHEQVASCIKGQIVREKEIGRENRRLAGGIEFQDVLGSLIGNKEASAVIEG